MPQLRILDLSFNDLTGLSSWMFGKLSRLTHLNLSGNSLIQTLDSGFTQFLTETALTNLQELVMTNTGLQEIMDNALSVLTQLISLDISRNPMVKFDKNPLGGLVRLRELHADNPRLCCLIVHDTECYAPVDELSSCSDLLRRDVSRVCLWAFSVLALVGNAGVIAYRVASSKRTPWSTFHVLVVNLSAADLLMGVYMTMIGAADARFRGDYVTRDNEWRHSNTCIAAGFLAFVSSEVSAFMISLITLDRFLRLCFPFKAQVHMGLRSCTVLCSVAWLCGVCLAAVPLIAQLQFYGVTGICLPLPITRHSFSGHSYAFSVFIGMNFALFVLIGAGQVAIYRAIRATSKAAGSKRQNRDTTIARRLFLVVLTDFCCWFPIGVMGLMAFLGIPIPGEVNVWAAILVLPFNSALNPFLYTLNGLCQKWEENKVEKKTQKILANLEAEISKLPPRSVEALVMSCHRSNKVNAQKLHSLDRPEQGTASTAVSQGTAKLFIQQDTSSGH
ncbi:G-protein coupled receptor GRL101-like [Littorina saxatilis]|uniref:G-protein coupled receptor GRL101-like n=1 Tax=Littorina saxatilis TaxID=31220 RepID=UPI0038B5EE00